MKKIFVILFIVVFLIIGANFFLKVKNIDDKIKLTQISFTYPKNFTDIKNLFADYFYTNITLTISNYSNIPIIVNQAKINLYTLKNNLFCEQYAPLEAPFVIKPNTNTQISIKYQIFYTYLVNLIKDNDLKFSLDEIIKAVQTFSIGTNVKVKGIVTADKLTLPINTTVEI